MTPEDKSALLTIKRNLHQIKETGRAPINLTLYKKMGLITVRHKTYTGASGNPVTVLDRLCLTEKARQLLNTAL